jgi:DNA-binding transcriptional ArsR family regulator
MSTEQSAVGEPSIEGDEELPLSKDTQFGILKNSRRRDMLRYLREHGGESTLSDLAELIAAKENGVERRLLSSDERKRVYIGLYQCHLPKMDDAGIVDFDKRSGSVHLRSEARQLFRHIDDVPDDASVSHERGESNAVPTRLGTPVKLAVSWALCALVVLSSLEVVTFLGTVGSLGIATAAAFAVVETIDALPSLPFPDDEDGDE